jgi:hypothetical protein
MSLIKSNSKWILFLSSSADPEERHIWDLAFGLMCLESAGIKSSDIYIYIDGKDRKLIAQLISNGSKAPPNIKESHEFFTDQNNNTHDNLVMFVTGHGGIEGIEASKPITPHTLLQHLKSAPNLKQAVVFLGQCHAGIFNYIGAGRRIAHTDTKEPELIFIGATNLHNSLSLSTQENFVNGSFNWIANLFLLHIFKWVSNPFDLDGDGKTTIIDAYKYAGAMSNVANKNAKVLSFVRSLDLHSKWTAAHEAYQKDSTAQNQLTLDAISTQYENELSNHYTHQECWILNAIPAQSIEL